LAKRIRTLPRRSLIRHVEHRDCATWDHGRRQLAIPLLGLDEVNQRRISGEAYDGLVEEFIAAAQQIFPGVLIQFEDFANHSAFRLLEHYRERACVFNDDIQGTAAVALAGLFSALRVTGEKLSDQTVLFLGAGEAATGIADLIISAMTAEGLSEAEARRRNWLFDSRGLVVGARNDLTEHKRPYAHDHAPVRDYPSAIRDLKPTAIIQGRIFKAGIRWDF